MEKIPTAREFIISTELVVKFDNTQSCILEEELPRLFIEFAKLHVEAALKEASETAIINKNKGQVTGREFGNVTDGSYSINQPSILNSYSPDNIK